MCNRNLPDCIHVGECRLELDEVKQTLDHLAKVVVNLVVVGSIPVAIDDCVRSADAFKKASIKHY